MKATLSNYGQSPRKVRLLADLVRGKEISIAIAELTYLPKRASLPLRHLLESAVANAIHNFNLRREDLFIKEIKVDKGLVMKRFRARARGRAAPIRHRTSYINVVLGQREENMVTKENKTTTETAEPKSTPVKKTTTKTATKK